MKDDFLYTLVYLWNGVERISGTLSFDSNTLVFMPIGFENSHLKYIIPITEIKSVTLFRLFDIADNGVTIETNDGKKDIFILEHPKKLKKELLLLIQVQSNSN